jgi:hypothetical protein
MRRGVVTSLAFAFVVAASGANADGPSPATIAQAREAYARGEAALKVDDFVIAAQEFSRADATVPNDTALATALRAATHTQEADLAARLLNRASVRAGAEIARAAQELTTAFADRLASVRIGCPQASTCTAEVDFAAARPGERTWVVPGRHAVAGTIDGAPAKDVAIDAPARSDVAVTLERPPPPTVAPPPEPPPAAEPKSGLSPTWFWIGAGATLVLAGVSTWSTIDLFSKHGTFEDRSCASAANADCRSLASDGKSADARTAVLWSATGVVAAATLASAFFVRWHGASVGAAPLPGGAAAGVYASF